MLDRLSRLRQTSRRPITRLTSAYQVGCAPLAFFDHSRDSVLDFEVAREFRDELGLSAAYVVVCAHCAPQLSDYRPLIHDLPDAKFVDPPSGLNGILTEKWGDLWLKQTAVGRVWANFALCETLACIVGERFSFPIAAITASCDPLVNRKKWLPAASKHLLRSHFMIVPDDHFFLDMWRRFAETVTETLQNSMLENDN